MESGIVLMLRLMRGSSARFVFKDFRVAHYFCTHLFRRVFPAYVACIIKKKSSISNCPLTSFRFVMFMEIICRKIFGFSLLLNSFVTNIHTLHWVWVNLVLCCTVVLNVGLYHLPSLVSHVTPWKKWFLRNLVVIFSIFSVQ